MDISYSADYPNIFALENDKPKIENGSCVGCEDYLCTSRNGTACHNITTNGNTFYLTVYHNQGYRDSELIMVHVNEVVPFGKKIIQINFLVSFKSILILSVFAFNSFLFN